MRRRLLALAATLFLTTGGSTFADHDPSRIHWRGKTITNGVIHPIIGHDPLFPYVYTPEPRPRPVTERRLGIFDPSKAAFVDDPCEGVPGYRPYKRQESGWDEFACRSGDDEGARGRAEPAPATPTVEHEPEPKPEMDKPKRDRKKKNKRDRRRQRH